MKRLIFIILLTINASFYNCQSDPYIKKFPIENLDFYQSHAHLKIVVFMPSLYEDCEYASMLTNAFQYYFVKGLAFKDTLPKIDVVLIVNDIDQWANKKIFDSLNKTISLFESKNMNLLDNMIVKYDSSGKYFHACGLNTFKTKTTKAGNMEKKTRNESSILYLLNGKNEILLHDTDYKAQGEHLKPLEHKIKSYLGLSNKSYTSDSNVLHPLKVGDRAPNFILDKVSEHPEEDDKKDYLLGNKKQLKVITFYPAAFSGQLLPDFSREDQIAMMSCSAQIKRFSLNPLLKQYQTYLISSSTNELLRLWQNALRTTGVNYINDPDYKIAKLYNAYNPKGYCNRVTYIIDPNGIIKYIDMDFTVEDEPFIERQIQDLLKK
jgi:peroxiredoxin